MRRSLRRNFAFTLVELMISIAIALLLMLGINIVFAGAAKTVGAGNSLLDSTRNARTVLQTMLNDFNYVDAVPSPGSITGDAPFFIIYSQHTYAFRNIQDQAAAASQTDPATDPALFASTTIFPNNQAPVALPGDRSHRVDRVAFFTRALAARQTFGNAATAQFVSTTTGNEALVMYGHALMPDLGAYKIPSITNWFPPGSFLSTSPSLSAPNNSTTNINNYFACDWMLTRIAIILSPKIPSDGNVLQNKSTVGATLVDPLSPLDSSKFSVTQDGNLLAAGTSDMAQTSIASFAAQMKIYGLGQPFYHNSPGWWEQIVDSKQRLQVSPYALKVVAPVPVGAPKITPGTLAQCAPNLIRGCSQFIVEYAGNYYTKNPDGTGNALDTIVIDNFGNQQHAPVPDPSGAIDYYTTNQNGTVITGPSPGVAAAPSGATLYRHVRWYGFPRSTTLNSGAAPTVTPVVNPSTGDVVPLRDVLTYLGQGFTSGMPWSGIKYADAERFTFAAQDSVTSLSVPAGIIKSNYWSTLTQSNTAGLVPGPPGTPGTDESAPYTYVAAWGPDVQFQSFPKLIRITIELDDHEGRLSQPQRYEFIFEVQK